jgi:hypothetical protein
MELSYYGNYEGIEIPMVTLCVVGPEEVSFVIPKLDLIRASPVFERMFANEMTERATDKVVIEDTNPEEFGDFLKAISPKQELPNREFHGNPVLNPNLSTGIMHIIPSI